MSSCAPHPLRERHAGGPADLAGLVLQVELDRVDLLRADESRTPRRSVLVRPGVRGHVDGANRLRRARSGTTVTGTRQRLLFPATSVAARTSRRRALGDDEPEGTLVVGPDRSPAVAELPAGLDRAAQLERLPGSDGRGRVELQERRLGVDGEAEGAARGAEQASLPANDQLVPTVGQRLRLPHSPLALPARLEPFAVEQPFGVGRRRRDHELGERGAADDRALRRSRHRELRLGCPGGDHDHCSDQHHERQGDQDALPGELRRGPTWPRLVGLFPLGRPLLSPVGRAALDLVEPLRELLVLVAEPADRPAGGTQLGDLRAHQRLGPALQLAAVLGLHGSGA